MGRPTIRLGVLLLVALGVCAGSEAQQLGQWWWTADAGIFGRDLSNTSGGATTSESRQTDYRLRLDLNGFVIHPAVGRFRLGLDTRFTDVSGGRSVDTGRWGFLADTRWFPQGSMPFGLYVGHELYDYSAASEEDPLVLFGAPESSTRWGGDLAFRHGLLRGTRLGFDRTEIGYRDPDARNEIRENQFVEWSPRTRTIRHVLRLERRYREFGTVDFVSDDLTFTLRQSGMFAPGWRWDLSGVAIHRTTTTTTRDTAIDTGRLRANTSTDLGDDLLRFTYSSGAVGERGSDLSSVTHDLEGGYLVRSAAGWEVGPTAGYSLQRSGDVTLTGPRVGVTASWNGSFGGLALLLSGQASYLHLQRELEGAAATDNRLALGAQLSLSRGTADRLLTQLEASASRNQLRVAGDFDDFPDLGVSLGALGTEDVVRGRLTASGRGDGSPATSRGGTGSPTPTTRPAPTSTPPAGSTTSPSACGGSPPPPTPAPAERPAAASTASRRTF